MDKNEVDRLANQSIRLYMDTTGIRYDVLSGGRYLKLIDHDSCIVDCRKTTNHPTETFYWNSRGVGGNLMNFLQNYVEVEPGKVMSSLKTLDDKYKHQKQPVYRITPEKPYDARKWQGDPFHTDQVEKYLTETRKLDTNLVRYMLDHDLLRQLPGGDALFVWKSKTGKEVGADIQGTNVDHKKFRKRGTRKMVVPHSMSHHGFSFQKGSGTDVLCVFESPIDALSYAEMQHNSPEKNVTFLSINGAATKLGTLDEYLKQNGVPKKINLCFDSDRGGKTAVIKYLRDHKQVGNKITIGDQLTELNVARPSASFKDWNESLQNGVKYSLNQSAQQYVHSLVLQDKKEVINILEELRPGGHRIHQTAMKSQSQRLAPTKETSKSQNQIRM